MNFCSFYRKHFAWYNFSLLNTKYYQKICFLSSELLLVCCVYSISLENGLKETGRPCKNGSSELREFLFHGLEPQSFPSYIAESTSFASVHTTFSPLWLCWDYWLLAFHRKITFVVLWCGLLNISYVAFLVFVKGLTTLMCKPPKGVLFLWIFFILRHMWSDPHFCIFIIVEW